MTGQPTGEGLRLLRLGALLTWTLVGVPLVVEGGVDLRAFGGWLAAYLTFGIALWLSLSSLPRKPAAGNALLALQSLSVVGLVLLLCNGFEGTLLVLVAMQLAWRVPRRIGLGWIAAQSLLLGAAIAHHWSLRAAVLLAPPYLGFQLLGFALFEALGREADAHRDLARANAELVSAQELLAENTRLSERLRISRELHDAVGHHLVALSLNLEVAAHQAHGPARDQIEIARSLAKLLLGDVGDVVETLNSPRAPDLRAALEALATGLPHPRVHLSLPPDLSLEDRERANTILRCSQEIVTNAAKHGAAENLWIEIVQEGSAVEIRARDDGRGCAALREGRGLSGMRERLGQAGGTLDVCTSPGAGFRLRATIPVRG